MTVAAAETAEAKAEETAAEQKASEQKAAAAPAEQKEAAKAAAATAEQKEAAKAEAAPTAATKAEDTSAAGAVDQAEAALQAAIETIVPASESARDKARLRWNSVAKPLHSLGKLEDAVVQMAGIKGTAEYTLEKKGLLVLCADNGVTAQGVTQTGPEVTAVVADNFTCGETSTSIMAEIAGVDVFPVDIGMFTDVESVTKPEYKVMYGTNDFSERPAMSREQAAKAVLTGIRLVQERKEEGYGLLATGEMGIGNTTTSSAVTAALLGLDPQEVTGRGAGLSTEGLHRKVQVIREAIEKHRPDPSDPLDVLSKVGGLDIAGLAGVFLGGAIYHIPVLLDGFISSTAALCAVRMAPAAAEYMLPSHRSSELAGGLLLDELGLSPLLDCRMSLGEGSGAVAAVPLLEMGLAVYRQMSTFADIQVEAYQELI